MEEGRGSGREGKRVTRMEENERRGLRQKRERERGRESERCRAPPFKRAGGLCTAK